MKAATLIGIDVGSTHSGIITITEKGIREGQNLENGSIVQYVVTEKGKCEKLYVVLEDIKPYNMRISDGIIRTIKVLGELEYRLKAANIKFELIPRWQVKQWVFLQFKLMAWPEIEKNIERHHQRKLKAIVDDEVVSLKKRTPTFVWVDDRIIQKAMRIHWGIPLPAKVGATAMYGLKDHSWQALGVASCYIALYNLSFLWKRATV